MDWWYGGLNYQIEHHSAHPATQPAARRPTASAGLLPRAGIPYHETSMAGSYREILGYLHASGAPLRALPRAL